ncbi:MAG: GTPase [Clostridia bacterium]|nr:GTPase [Clostridia bacterium]MDE7328230.1 GTPase [Clostridia bacterium]
MEIPVYLFTGFLESGKTKFIQEMMSDERFNEGEKTLLLVFEEGEEEYRPEFFASDNVHIEIIEDIDDITSDTLTMLAKKHKIKRVIVEYNGMLEVSKFFDLLPDDWVMAQILMIADSNTFFNYNTNMRQLTFDKMQASEAVIFNRFDDKKDKNEFHKIVRAAGRRIEILYEYLDGHVEPDNIPDPLPYDLNARIVEIKDEDYAEFYRDLVEDGKKYEGKILSFKGIVAVDKTLPKKTIVVGRHIMTCCEADIFYGAFVCTYTQTIDLKKRDWVKIIAKIRFGKHEVYEGEGPIFEAISIEKTQKPEQELATFN